MNDVPGFVDAVIAAFRKVKPVHTPPHGIIFAEAKKRGVAVKVSGMTEAYYTKNADKLFENADARLERVHVRLPNKTTLKFDWPDLRKLVFKGPQKALRSTP